MIAGGTGAIGARHGAPPGRARRTLRAAYARDAPAKADAVAGGAARRRPLRAAGADDRQRRPARAAAQVGERSAALHILVNSAGYHQAGAGADLDALTDELIDEMFQVNWRGAVRDHPRLRAAAEGARRRAVVNISSIAGFTGVGSDSPTAPPRPGIDIVTEALARALAPADARAAVSPGVVDTEFVPGRGADFNAKAAAGDAAASASPPPTTSPRRCGLRHAR